MDKDGTIECERSVRQSVNSIWMARRQQKQRYLQGAGTSGRWTIEYVAIGLLALAGMALQSYANKTADALTVGIFFLLVGFGMVKVVFTGKEVEQQAFLLTYGICVFVGGMAQCYSLAVFDNPQSTVDAVNSFLPAISPAPPWTTFAEMNPNFNFRLAVVIWQQVYKLTWLLGLKFGLYAAVLFNAFMMALTASITVTTGRELFGNDVWRLRRVGILFAFCGLFILFGAVLLRDCFTTFFNALVLWSLIRWLVRPGLKNLLFAVVATSISAWAMLYLREASTVMFGFFTFLAFLFWLQRERFKPTVLIAGLFVLSILFIASPYVLDFLSTSRAYQTLYKEGYSAQSEEMAADSLAMQMIVRQPLPVRLIVGSGSLLVFPMPLWAYLKSGALDYNLIKTWHGFYQVFIVPLVFTGILAVFRLFQRDLKASAPWLFLAVYMLLNWLAVVATSMEQRHLAQFMPAFLILAAVPDTRNHDTHKDMRWIAITWFVLVGLLHLAWIVLKGMQ